MKKLPLQLLAFLLGALVWGAFLVPTSFAQSSGNFDLVSQGDISSTTQLLSSDSSLYVVDIGSGYVGTSTGAFLSAYWTAPPAGTNNAYLTLLDNTTGSYCAFQYQTSTAVPSSQAFVQLVFDTCSGSDTLAFVPADDYSVEIQFTGAYASPYSFFYRGTAQITNPTWSLVSGDGTNFFPQFSIVGNGFQITPTASSSGLLLSGALSYCAGAFASSSAPAVIADTGVALCDVGGFLFVPTPDSIQQYQNTLPVLEGKIPFSYAYGLVALYSSLTASTTENLPSFAIPFPSLIGSSTPLGNIVPSTIPIMSTTTISLYYPDPLRESFLFLGSCAIWVEALLVCYRRIVPHKVL